MAIPLNVNGTPYSYPQEGDVGYAAQATAWAQAMTGGVLQLGGVYTLLSDLNLSAFGVLAPYFTSKTASPALTGAVRLAKTDALKFRNNANSADLAGLALNAQDNLTANGAQLDGQPHLQASVSIAQTLISTSTIVVFNLVAEDTDSAYNSGTGRYTIPTGKGGHWLICASVVYQQVTSTGLAEGNVYVNAALNVEFGARSIAAAAFDCLSGSAVLKLNAGDVVDFRVKTSAGTLSTAASNFSTFSLKRLV